ncbi:aminoglycoside phosphotransferase family protein [Kitasatospora sp. NPDC098652]|uniref:aminoglycoside phosphotransferase family protein n=1 Tax=Kitasatospora sp. NPDC098652 TaxID=3364095 RepID=UPI003802F9B4
MITRRDASRITAEAENALLEAHGLTPADLIAAGTEARVYALGHDQVLKVYADPDQLGALETIADLYQRFDRTSVPFALPEIQSIEQHGPLLAVTETRLSGTPMGDALDLTDPATEAEYLAAVRDFTGLRLTTPLDRRMLLDPDPAHQGEGWNAFLRRLLGQKLPKVLADLRLDVPAVDSITERLTKRLARPYTGPEGVIHGDLYPDNILVTADGKVSAVIDFGTFTLLGDPLYDLAGACAYYRMYDEDRVDVRNRLLAAAAQDLPAERRDDLADYLHLVALLSCDLYPEQDKDIRDTGHYQWAADVLNTSTEWKGR